MCVFEAFVFEPQHKEILDDICSKLGQSESETLRVIFLDSAKSINLITAKVHEKIKRVDSRVNIEGEDEG